MKFLFRCLLATLLLSFFYSCHKTEERSAVFDPNGKSTLTIINKSSDSAYAFISNWLNLPPIVKEEKIEAVIAPGETVQLPITTEARDYYNLTLNRKQYQLFSESGKNIVMTIPSENEEAIFSGDFNQINRYLKSRFEIDRGAILHSDVSFTELIVKNDSLTQLLQTQLANDPKLPNWYKEFEHLRLNYDNAQEKLGYLYYRKKIKGSGYEVSDDFFAKTTKGLSIERVDLVGVTSFMRYVEVYIRMMRDPDIKRPTPTNKEEWINEVEELIETSDTHIQNQKIKDVHLANFYSLILEALNHVWQDKWLAHIKDPEILTLVQQQASSKDFLAEGSPLPYFELPDKDGTVYKSTDFKGEVVLINFWASWCGPCLKEFPFENKLVEQFKNQPVAIVNISLDTTSDYWESVLKKYDLKMINLFTDSKWSSKINKEFDVNGLPHSVLVDANGKIIKNKCARASAGVDALIEDALKKMKEKDVQ